MIGINDDASDAALDCILNYLVAKDFLKYDEILLQANEKQNFLKMRDRILEPFPAVYDAINLKVGSVRTYEIYRIHHTEEDLVVMKKVSFVFVFI